MRIVFIEDEPLTDPRVLEHLRQRGNELLLLKSSEFTEHRVVHFQPKVAVVDMWLRHASGFELCRKIRRTPSLHRVSILASMSQRDQQELDHALHQGADDVAEKPYRAGELMEKVSRLTRLYDCANEVHAETGLPSLERFKKVLAHRLALGEKVALCSFEVGGIRNSPGRGTHAVTMAIIAHAAASLREVAAAHGVPFDALGYLGGGFLGAIIGTGREEEICQAVTWNLALNEAQESSAHLRLYTRVVHAKPSGSCSPMEVFSNLHGLIQGVAKPEQTTYLRDRRSC